GDTRRLEQQILTSLRLPYPWSKEAREEKSTGGSGHFHWVVCQKPNYIIHTKRIVNLCPQIKQLQCRNIFQRLQ
uniref:Rep protein n=1 Tax=Mesocestoides corti TaxID=53468 RepID=A0A5K3EZW4_MESCO